MTQLSDLSKRRREIAELVGDGLSYLIIGQRLGISTRTVEGTVYVIAEQLGGDESVTPYRRIQRWVLEQRTIRHAV